MPTETTPTVPTTLLGAVNELLKAIGRAPVMSLLIADTNQDAQDAMNTIRSASVEIQSGGWPFNAEDNYPLTPAPDGTITLPENLLWRSVAPQSRLRVLTVRGNRVYDRAGHTFEIGPDTIYANVTTLLPYEDIPQPVRWYIVAEAGQRFGTQKKPDSTTYRFTSDVRNAARQAALDYHAEDEDMTLPESNRHFADMRKR